MEKEGKTIWHKYISLVDKLVISGIDVEKKLLKCTVSQWKQQMTCMTTVSDY